MKTTINVIAAIALLSAGCSSIFKSESSFKGTGKVVPKSADVVANIKKTEVLDPAAKISLTVTPDIFDPSKLQVFTITFNGLTPEQSVKKILIGDASVNILGKEGNIFYVQLNAALCTLTAPCPGFEATESGEYAGPISVVAELSDDTKLSAAIAGILTPETQQPSVVLPSVPELPPAIAAAAGGAADPAKTPTPSYIPMGEKCSVTSASNGWDPRPYYQVAFGPKDPLAIKNAPLIPNDGGWHSGIFKNEGLVIITSVVATLPSGQRPLDGFLTGRVRKDEYGNVYLGYFDGASTLSSGDIFSFKVNFSDGSKVEAQNQYLSSYMALMNVIFVSSNSVTINFSTGSSYAGGELGKVSLMDAITNQVQPINGMNEISAPLSGLQGAIDLPAVPKKGQLLKAVNGPRTSVSKVNCLLESTNQNTL